MQSLILNFYLLVFWAILFNIIPISKKQRNKCFSSIAFIQLVIVHTFVDVNSLLDLPHYERSFYELSNVSLNQIYKISLTAKMEDGYILFMKLVSMIGGDFRFFLFLNSLLIIYPYFYIINKYSSNIIISILIYVLTMYSQSLFVLRQHLAISLLLISYPLILNGKYFKFCILSLIAFYIHQTSLIFIPVMFLYNVKSLRNFKILLVLFMIFIGILFPILFVYFGEYVLSGYGSYVNDEGTGSNFVNIAIQLTYLMLYVYFLKKEVYNEGINKLMYILLFFGFILFVSGLGFAGIPRLAMYFSLVPFLIIPIILKYCRKPLLRIIMCVMFFIVLYYMNFYGSSSVFIENFKLEM